MLDKTFLSRGGFATLLVAIVALSSCVQKNDAQLVIYAYDSFASEWGPAPVVIPAFEKATGIKVELVVPGDAGQVLARVHPADGLDQLDAVEIEDRLGARVVPDADVVAGQAQHVVGPQQAGGEQLGLKRQAVSVSASNLINRFIIHFLQFNRKRP